MSRQTNAPARDSGAQPATWLSPAGRGGVLLSCAALIGLAVFTLRGWLRAGLPTTDYGETLAELTITWMFRQELLSGRVLSEWNPAWFSGMPWLRFLSYPVYYPLAALSAWGGLALERVMVLYHLTVVALSGLAMFGYLRCVWRDWRVALVGAVIYETWPYHHWLGAETWIHALVWVWVPLTLWAIEQHYRNRVSSRNSVSRVFIGILLGALPVISSEYALVAGPFLLLYLVARGVANARATQRRAGALLGEWAVTGLVALGVSAFFVLPALLELQFVGIHAKHGLGSTLTTASFKDYWTSLALFGYGIATRLGLPASSEGLPAIGRLWDVAWYPGLAALALALLGLAALARDVRRRSLSAGQRLAAWASLTGLLLALLWTAGGNVPLNPFTYIPVLRNVVAVRGMLLVGVFLSALAAVGMHWILSFRNRVFLKNSVSILLVTLTCAVVILDHWPSAAVYRTTPSYFTADEQAAYAWLGERGDGLNRLWDKVSAPAPLWTLTYSLSQAALPRFGGYYDNGATFHSRVQIWSRLVASPAMLALHQTRYVLLRRADADYAATMPPLLAAGYRVAYENDTLQVLARQKLGSYARFYQSVALDMNADDIPFLYALEVFQQSNIAVVAASVPAADLSPAEMSRYAYVFADQAVPPHGAAGTWIARDPGALITTGTLSALAVAPAENVAAQVLRPSTDLICVDVTVGRRGLLTVAESWYPNWRVTVDGKAQPLLRANGALLGVWLSAGEHRIEFRYRRPRYVYLGFGLTACTWLGMLLWGTPCVWEAYLRRRAKVQAPQADGEAQRA